MRFFRLASHACAGGAALRALACCLGFVAGAAEGLEVVGVVVVAGLDVVDVGCAAVAAWVVCGGLAVVVCSCEDLTSDVWPVGWESLATVAC